MYKFYFIIFLNFMLSCNKNHHSNDKNFIKTETIESKSAKIINSKKGTINDEFKSDWQENFGLTHDIDKDSIWDEPVRFYVDNPMCDKTTIAFYFGKFKPEDTEETNRILQLVSTDNINLRPFYRWVLDKTIQIQDGALGEYTGVPARRYAEKFPKEFFEFMDNDPSGEKYANWYNAILYSGFYEDDDYYKPMIVRKNFEKTMKLNCNNCNENVKIRIEKFALACFPYSEN